MVSTMEQDSTNDLSEFFNGCQSHVNHVIISANFLAKKTIDKRGLLLILKSQMAYSQILLRLEKMSWSGNDDKLAIGKGIIS